MVNYLEKKCWISSDELSPIPCALRQQMLFILLDYKNNESLASTRLIIMHGDDKIRFSTIIFKVKM